MKRPIIFVLLQSLLSCMSMTVSASQIVQGAIQFPASVSTVPDLRVYYAGNKIVCEADPHNKLTFSLPVQDIEGALYVIITESIQVKAKENTIECLQVAAGRAYKFYRLELVEIDGSYQWNITPQLLSYDGRIPDSTVIICFNPTYISTLSGGSDVALPTLILDHDLIDRLGSESKLHDLSCELLLACLDFDTIHRVVNAQVKHGDPCRTLVLLNS